MYYIETRLHDGWVCLDYNDNGVMRKYSSVNSANLAIINKLSMLRHNKTTKVLFRVVKAKI